MGHNMRGNWNRLLDSENNVFSVSEVMIMYQLSRVYVNELIKSHNIKTVKEFSRILKEKRENKTRNDAVYLPNKHGEMFSIKQMAKKIGRSVSWVRRAHKEFGCRTVEELVQMKKDPPKHIKTNIYSKVLKFNRGKICYRNNFHSKCTHYSSCSDARCTGVHHERYKEDGSCFECDNLHEFEPVPVLERKYETETNFIHTNRN